MLASILVHYVQRWCNVGAARKASCAPTIPKFKASTDKYDQCLSYNRALLISFILATASFSYFRGAATIVLHMVSTKKHNTYDWVNKGGRGSVGQELAEDACDNVQGTEEGNLCAQMYK